MSRIRPIVHRSTSGLVAAVVLVTAAPAWSVGGLTLAYQSNRAAGAAFAFAPTINGDASAAFYNPAGLAGIDKTQLRLGSTVLYLDYRIDGKGLFNPAQANPSEPAVVPGDRSIDPSTLAAAFDLYFAMPLTDRLTFGAGLNVPFGFIQHFPDEWSGRYQATATTILSQNLGLTLGWRALDNFRVGGGINIQYLFFQIENDVDAGTRLEEQFDTDCPAIVNSTTDDTVGQILASLGQVDGGLLGAILDGLATGAPLDEVACGTATTPGLIEPTGLAGTLDFENVFDLDGFGIGFNFGFQWDVTPSTTIGFHYTSAIHHTLTGTADRDNGGNLAYARDLQNNSDGAGEQLLLQLREPLTAIPPPPAGETYASLVTLRALQNSNDQQAEMDLTTPETINIGVDHRFTERLRVGLSYAWTNWSRFDEFKFHYTSDPRFFDGIFRQVIGRELRPAESVDRRDNPTVQPINFQDVARYAVGFDYRASQALNLRAGFAYVEPVLEGDTITDRMRAPIGITRLYTVGATIRPHAGLSIDLALAYTRLDGGEIRQLNVASKSLNRFRGEFSDVNIYAAGMTMRYAFE